ncbi:hypothetical protein C2845_PM11G17300 [Panicum miliaceum]|uniref:GDSL esterase/lipase n=1 Tax=Panicum miliaceum TaxID=4540 RepID=A0A3L6RNX4_PANMI|nr:hypothetical protein C2845_PM11G17300 [Panicum miliaceum]
MAVSVGAQAKALGLGISPAAYLSLPVPISMVNFTGVNYASEGARIWNNFYADDSTQVTIPLLEQVDKFVATKAQMEPKLGRSELKKVLSNSIFLLSFGTTDRFHVWYLQNLMFKNDQTNVQYLLSSYGVGIKALFEAGARKFAVINVPPIGCTPGGQMPWRRRGYVRGQCDKSKNKLAMEFNDGLRHLLATFSSELHGFRYSVADLYGFANATFATPSAAGFVNTNTQCCPNPCMPGFGEPCENRSQYWFWDYSYPTEKAAKLAAAAFYDGSAQFTVPINFKKLVQRK